jgi:hypothetical protein
METDINRVVSKVIRIISGGKKDSKASLNTKQDLSGYFCPNPFRQLDIYENGKAFTCCSSWLPKSIGNVNDAPIADLWNSEASQAIRKSILDGTFKYCDSKVCPAIQSKSLPKLEEARKDSAFTAIIDEKRTALAELPAFINLCNDASCNLYCPSCRKKRILHTKGKELEKRQHLQDIIESQLFSEPSNRHFSLNITGSGDPFASTVFRQFLFNLNGDDFPNLKIHLQTNGVLLTPSNWKKIDKIHKNIAIVLISFDAATEKTYGITRKGGHWETLLANVARLGEARREGKLEFLRLDFVVQDVNFAEMPAFVRLGRSLGADEVAFSMVLDWGTWSQAQYQEKCIWKTDHPKFNEFLSVLKDPILDDPFVNLGNLTEYRKTAMLV